MKLNKKLILFLLCILLTSVIVSAETSCRLGGTTRPYRELEADDGRNTVIECDTHDGDPNCDIDEPRGSSNAEYTYIMWDVSRCSAPYTVTENKIIDAKMSFKIYDVTDSDYIDVQYTTTNDNYCENWQSYKSQLYNGQGSWYTWLNNNIKYYDCCEAYAGKVSCFNCDATNIFNSWMDDGVSSKMCFRWSMDDDADTGTDNSQLRGSGGTSYISLDLKINDPPSLSGCPDASINEDSSGSGINLHLPNCATDKDDSKSDLIFSIDSQSNAGLINCYISSSKNLRCNNPAPDKSGYSNIKIKAFDGYAYSNQDTLKITVNPVPDAPVLTNCPDDNIDEDTLGSGISVNLHNCNNDVEDGDDVTFAVVSESNKGLIDCYIKDNKYLTCQNPKLNGEGYSDIVIRSTDPTSLSDTDTIKVVINPVNDPPQLTGCVDVQILEDEQNQLSLLDLKNCNKDPDVSDSWTYKILSQTNSGLANTFIAGSVLKNYKPSPNAFGYSDIVVQVTDSFGLVDTDQIRLVVRSVNDLPVITLLEPENDIWNIGGLVDILYSVIDIDSEIMKCDLIVNDELVSTNQGSEFYIDLPAGHNLFYVECMDMHEGSSESSDRLIKVMRMNTFDGDTTDLNDVLDMSAVSDFVLEKTTYGKIKFLETLDLSEGYDFDLNVEILDNEMNVDLVALNKSAEISFYNIDFQEPEIKKQGLDCIDCEFVSYEESVLIYNVTDFSMYEIYESYVEPTPEPEPEPEPEPTPEPESSSSSGSSSGSSSSRVKVIKEVEKIEVIKKPEPKVNVPEEVVEEIVEKPIIINKKNKISFFNISLYIFVGLLIAVIFVALIYYFIYANRIN